MKLYPNFGSLTDLHEELANARDDSKLLSLFEESHQEYYTMLRNVAQSDSENSLKNSLDTQFLKKSVELNKDSFNQQFHYGLFYSYLKLKEQEINNIMWISECIKQKQKERINEYIVIYE